MRVSLFLSGALFAATASCSRPSAPERRGPGESAAASSNFPRDGLRGERTDTPLDVDPPGPAGDLAAEVAAFTDLPACVARHAATDPLVADSVDALGYERLLWDSCRSLEALGQGQRGPCDRILASALQRSCLGNLAVWKGEPELCPREEPAEGVVRHDVRCLAAARRDVRPCSVLRGVERAACEGFVARDPARCGTDLRCARHVLRWRSVLPVPLGASPYAGRITVDVTGSNDVARGRERQTMELPDEAAAGAVLLRRPGLLRVVVGDLRPVFVTAARQPGGGFWIDVPTAAAPADPGAEKTLGTSAGRVLWWSPSGVLHQTVGALFRLRIEQLTAEPNRPLKITFVATVGPQEAPRQTTWHVDTWVRDVVNVTERVNDEPGKLCTKGMSKLLNVAKIPFSLWNPTLRIQPALNVSFRDMPRRTFHISFLWERRRIMLSSTSFFLSSATVAVLFSKNAANASIGSVYTRERACCLGLAAASVDSLIAFQISGTTVSVVCKRKLRLGSSKKGSTLHMKTPRAPLSASSKLP